MVRHALKAFLGFTLLVLLASDPALGQAKSEPKAVTFEKVLEFLELEVPDAKLRGIVSRSPTKFTLSPEQVEQLKQAGATEALIELMTKGPSTEDSADITSYVLILDCSNSMRELVDRKGTTKFDAARKGALDLIAAVPDGKELAMIVYGYDAKFECRAVATVRPISPIDSDGREKLKAILGKLAPAGHTPIANSLKAASKQVEKASGQAKIILITDGLETCKGDPEAEAAKLVQAYPQLQGGVNVIGYGLRPEEVKKVRKIATAGNGQFFDARTTKDLVAAVNTVKQTLDKAPPVDSDVSDALKETQRKVSDALKEHQKKMAEVNRILAERNRKKKDDPPPVESPLLKEELMVWVEKDTSSKTPSLFSELSINDQFVESFTSESRKSIGKYVKEGMNTIVLKTKPNRLADAANALNFQIGPVDQQSGGNLLMRPMWRFDNDTDWSFENGKHAHALGPDKKEVEVRFQVYYGGTKFLSEKTAPGDFLIQASHGYQTRNNSLTATVYVNDTPLTGILGERQQVVVTKLLKQGRNELKIVSHRVENAMGDNGIEIHLAGHASGTNAVWPIVQAHADLGWVRDEQDHRLYSRLDRNADTIERVIPFHLDKDPNEGPTDLLPGGQPGLMLWANRDYETKEASLHSEVRINDELVGIFTSNTQRNIAGLIKPGENRITVKTYGQPHAGELNALVFKIGLAHKDSENHLTMKTLWTFTNGTDWKYENGEHVHAAAPDAREAVLEFPLRYEGFERHSQEIKKGDYVLQASADYGSYNLTSIVGNVLVNGTPLNSFLQEDQQVIITPLLKQGRNEITFSSTRLNNVFRENGITVKILGPAKWNASAESYQFEPVLEWKGLDGWKRNEETRRLEGPDGPDEDSLQQVLPFNMEEAVSE